MVNLQTCLLIISIIYLLSSNWGNLSIFNKPTTAIITISKLIICYIIFYYFSETLGLKRESDLYIYYNQALKLDGSLNSDTYSILNILLGNDSKYETTLSQLTLWERDFDYGLPNDNKTMIKIHLFLNLVLGKSILNHLLIIILLSITSLFILLKQLNTLVRNQKVLVFIPFLPSLLIWANGTYKENIAITIHLLIISILLKMNKNLNPKYLIQITLLCLIHLFVKPIYLFLILPFLLCFIIYKTTPLKKKINRLFILSVISILAFLTLNENKTYHEKDEYKYGNKFNPIKMIEYKQDDFFYEAYHNNAKTLVKLTPLKINNLSVFKSSYDAVINVFTLPSLLYPKKFESIPFIFENLLLYFLIIISLKNYKTLTFFPEDKFFLLAGITLCFFAGISTPVLGVLIKFKSLGYIYLVIGMIKLNFQKVVNE